jgi:hypothetical protein
VIFVKHTVQIVVCFALAQKKSNFHKLIVSTFVVVVFLNSNGIDEVRIVFALEIDGVHIYAVLCAFFLLI